MDATRITARRARRQAQDADRLRPPAGVNEHEAVMRVGALVVIGVMLIAAALVVGMIAAVVAVMT